MCYFKPECGFYTITAVSKHALACMCAAVTSQTPREPFKRNLMCEVHTRDQHLRIKKVEKQDWVNRVELQNSHNRSRYPIHDSWKAYAGPALDSVSAVIV